MPTRVSQDSAQAGHDIVGRDKIETHIHVPSSGPSVVETLLRKLQAEIEKNEQVRHTIDSLAHFHERKSPDGIDGLEAKLQAAGRSRELMDALEKKEMFAKLLEKWSLYASAQEIFAYLLAKAEYEFNYIIYPQIPRLEPVQVNQLVSAHIIEPVIKECGAGVFTLNHSLVMGMLYWLAEQCFVRWHS